MLQRLDSARWPSRPRRRRGSTRPPLYQHYVFVFPQSRSSCPFAGHRRDRRPPRLDQRRLLGAGARARARAQPRARARRRARLHRRRRARAHGRLVHGRRLRVRRSVRRHGERRHRQRQSLVRQMSMEHKLALHLLPTSAVKVVGDLGHLPHRADGDAHAERPSSCASPSPAAATTSSSTASRSASSTARRPPLRERRPRSAPKRRRSRAIRPSERRHRAHRHASGQTPEDWTDAAMDVGSGLQRSACAASRSGTSARTRPASTLAITVPARHRCRRARRAASRRSPAARRRNCTGMPRPTTSPSTTTSSSATESQVGTPVTTDFTDTGLVPGTTVSYTVAAVDAGGNIGPAAAVEPRDTRLRSARRAAQGARRS